MGNRVSGIAPAVAAALGALVLAVPFQAAAQAGPEPGALETLRQMKNQIVQARDEIDAGRVGAAKDRARKAHQLKLAAIRAGFAGQSVHGCPAANLIGLLELVDSAMSRAVAGDAQRLWLTAGLKSASAVAKLANGCAPQRPRALAKQVVDLIEGVRDRVAEKGDVSREKLRKSAERVELLKREMVAGELVYGCDVLRYFTLFQSIDRSLASVIELDEGDRRLIDSLLKRAQSDSTTLMERWRELPCDGGGQPPSGAFEVRDRLSWFHVNGFGTPPSRECNTVATDPPQTGAMVEDVITLPSGERVTKRATTDEDGLATISMDISQEGTYTHETTVTTADGRRVTTTASQTVTRERTGPRGECPPPTP